MYPYEESTPSIVKININAPQKTIKTSLALLENKIFNFRLTSSYHEAI